VAPHSLYKNSEILQRIKFEEMVIKDKCDNISIKRGGQPAEAAAGSLFHS